MLAPLRTRSAVALLLLLLLRLRRRRLHFHVSGAGKEGRLEGVAVSLRPDEIAHDSPPCAIFAWIRVRLSLREAEAWRSTIQHKGKLLRFVLREEAVVGAVARTRSHAAVGGGKRHHGRARTGGKRTIRTERLTRLDVPIYSESLAALN